MTPVVLDILVAVILGLSIIIAYVRGLIREVFMIVGLGAAALAAYQGGHILIPVFNRWLGVEKDGGEKAAEVVSAGAGSDIASIAAARADLVKDELIFGILSPGVAAKLASYGSVFLCIFLIFALLSFFLSESVKSSGLGIIDRLAGGVFGFARGFLLVFLFYVPWTFLMDADRFPAWARNSITVPILQDTLVFADEQFDLKKKIVDRGDGIVIKIDKIDEDEFGKDLKKVQEEFTNQLTHEEQGVQPRRVPGEGLNHR